ncbi:MAG: gluconeogenesis factor YvcK family protein [Candidatus Korobacteraceae bacterium]|jgi:uncharacterized cofD-like protein
MNSANESRVALKVVAIGGGTGLATLLRGLKQFVSPPQQAQPRRLPETPSAAPAQDASISSLTAVVTVTDDGGSSGRLRKDMGVLPPGDIRNCMIALSEDEELLARVFQYRFSSGELEGHSFGNLFLTALSSITGDFAEAVKLSSGILKTRGEIVPSTVSNVELDAWMDDGSRVHGETQITASNKRIMQVKLVPANARPLPQTLRALAEADLITIGPGSLFTSLAPNLLVHGIPEAIAASPALKVYVCNLMTQANESLGLSASEHIRVLFQHAGRPIFQYALLNTSAVPPALKLAYAAQQAEPIANDLEQVRALGVEPLLGEYLDDTVVARHNTRKLAHDLMKLARTRRPQACG